jgi:hypothetical protein
MKPAAKSPNSAPKRVDQTTSFIMHIGQIRVQNERRLEPRFLTARRHRHAGGNRHAPPLDRVRRRTDGGRPGRSPEAPATDEDVLVDRFWQPF